jgi:hypothetical protein
MGMTMRVSLPGYNAGTDTNLDNYALYADTDNVLIKEKVRGTITLGNNANGTVTHNLGYIPFFAVYMGSGSESYSLHASSNYTPFYAYSGTDNLYFWNASGGTRTFSYYIFYDQQK